MENLLNENNKEENVQFDDSTALIAHQRRFNVNKNDDRIGHKSGKHEIAVNLVMNFSPDANTCVMRKSS